MEMLESGVPRTKTSEKVAKDTEPSRAELDLPTVLHALSDEIRLDIIRQLHQNGEKPCGTFGIDVPKSTLSHHFRVLRIAGVLSQHRHGKELMNSVRRDDVDARFPGLLKSVIGAITSKTTSRRMTSTSG